MPYVWTHGKGGEAYRLLGYRRGSQRRLNPRDSATLALTMVYCCGT